MTAQQASNGYSSSCTHLVPPCTSTVSHRNARTPSSHSYAADDISSSSSCNMRRIGTFCSALIIWWLAHLFQGLQSVCGFHELIRMLVIVPIIVVSSQPPLRQIAFIVGCNVVLICRENPSPRILQIYLHDSESWRMTRRVAKRNTRSNLDERSIPGFPI